MATHAPTQSLKLSMASPSLQKDKMVNAGQLEGTQVHQLIDAVASTRARDDHERNVEDEKMMEGFLLLRIHMRRRRYCVLRGRTLHVFKTKEESMTSHGKPVNGKKTIVVVGVKDVQDLEKNVRISLLGNGISGNFENSLVISTQKSKLVVVEAETYTEKQRWLHAMSSLNFASGCSSERSFFQAILDDATNFDAHLAVTLLHKYRDNPIATELVIDRLAEYAEQNIDDVEFYIQQIIHLVVNTEMTKTDKLVNLLLSICKAKTYVEHLGNCIHLPLQLFWLLEAKIEEKDPKTYNLCAKLVMSIEAKVVNQHFELPGTCAADGGSVSTVLMGIPGMKERLVELKKKKSVNQEALDNAKASSPRTVELSSTTNRDGDNGVHRSMFDAIPSESDTHDIAADPMQQRELLLQWMETERHKRYKYFHQQRDFVRSLTDISEAMRAIDPPQERKRHLPSALEKLSIPEMAYIPLGCVSDPFCRVTRVLKDEGTVFSTHSRAPCLLCFEVIEDQVNAAGNRGSSISKLTSLPGNSARSLRLSHQRSSILSNSSSQTDEEAEIASYIKKYSVTGKTICVEAIVDHDEEDTEKIDITQQCEGNGEHVYNKSTPDLNALNRHFGIDAVQVEVVLDTSSRCDLLTHDSSISSISTSSSDLLSPTSVDACNSLVRQHSKTAYEFGLSKMLTDSGVFGESWKDKKERIRASSPYGHLPGWNVISLISKSNDDIRQEVFAMQLIRKFQDIFKEAHLPLYLRPYRIVSTGKNSGLLETITDAQSLDALKKRSDYAGLRMHFERTYGGCDPSSKAFKTAQRNFLHSLVGYSLVCYLLQIKDRHNGNILLDTDGHLIHIDFGFMLGIAPGGNWSFETAPFKLTKEIVEVLGGISSILFGEFVQLFVWGMLAAQRNAEKIITLVEIMMRNSTFPCFQGRDVSKDLQKLRDRFLLHCSTEEVVKHVMKMINTSYNNKWTKRYDKFQKLTNGIIP